MDTPHRDANPGISRRSLIKRAAAAGAVAWTAPVVIESLTSPAGAVSPVCKAYYLKMSTATMSCYDQPPAAPAAGISPNVYCGYQSQPGCLGTGPNTCPGSISLSGSSYTVTVPGTFSNTIPWQVQARYGGTNPSFTDTIVDYSPNSGSAVVIPKTFGTKNLSYVYLQYCGS